MSKSALKSVSLELWTFLGEAVLLAEMSDALFSFNDLLFCHTLEGLHPVLVHMDLELVQEVLGLDVRAVLVENVTVFDIRRAQYGLLMYFDWRKVVVFFSLKVV